MNPQLLNFKIPAELLQLIERGVWWDGAFRGAMVASVVLIVLYLITDRRRP